MEVLVFIGLFVLAFFAVFAALGYAIGKQKGQETMGLMLGFVLGPFGLLITCLLPDQSKPKRSYGRPYDDDYDHRHGVRLPRASASSEDWLNRLN